MTNVQSFHRNHLLVSLLESGCEDLHPLLELVPMKYGDVLCEAECELDCAYFPTTAVVSLLAVMESGASDEIAIVGNEGIIGVPLFLGARTSPHRIVVRSAGHAYRLRRQTFLAEFNRSGAMQKLLLRYTQALLSQISLTLACHRHHSIQQQFCRMLLSSIDRLPTNELRLTHESIAGMLGVRRETITKEAGELQAAGLIKTLRGRTVLLDRTRLEARACECYQGIKSEFGRLLCGAGAANRPNARPAGRYMPVAGTGSRAQLAALSA